MLAVVCKSWLRACALLIALLLDDSDSGGSDSDSSGDSDSGDAVSSSSDADSSDSSSGRQRRRPDQTGIATEVSDQDLRDIPKR